jgi:hypothetical protein
MLRAFSDTGTAFYTKVILDTGLSLAYADGFDRADSDASITILAAGCYRIDGIELLFNTTGLVFFSLHR